MRAKTFKQLQAEGTSDHFTVGTILKMEEKTRQMRKNSLIRWILFYTAILLIATPFILKNSDGLKNTLFNYGLASFISVSMVVGMTLMGNMSLNFPVWGIGMGVGVESETRRQRTRIFEKIMIPSLGYIISALILFVSWIL